MFRPSSFSPAAQLGEITVAFPPFSAGTHVCFQFNLGPSLRQQRRDAAPFAGRDQFAVFGISLDIRPHWRKLETPRAPLTALLRHGGEELTERTVSLVAQFSPFAIITRTPILHARLNRFDGLPSGERSVRYINGYRS